MTHTPIPAPMLPNAAPAGAPRLLDLFRQSVRQAGHAERSVEPLAAWWREWVESRG